MNYNDAENNRINKDYNSDRIYEYDRIYDKGDYCDKCRNDKMDIEERGCIDFGVYWYERWELKIIIKI